MFSLFPITRSHIEYFDSFAAVINSCELLWELERAEKCFLHSLWQNTLTARLFPQCYPLNLTQITAGISLSVSAVISKQGSGRTENTMCWEREKESFKWRHSSAEEGGVGAALHHMAPTTVSTAATSWSTAHHQTQLRIHAVIKHKTMFLQMC